MFKVGDRVRRLTYHPLFKIGQEGIVIENIAASSCCVVDMDRGGVISCHNANLELVERKMENSIFKTKKELVSGKITTSKSKATVHVFRRENAVDIYIQNQEFYVQDVRELASVFNEMADLMEAEER